MNKTGSSLKFVEKIAQGGMGEVWKGELVGPGSFRKLVAIKRIYSGDPDSLISEASNTAKLVHPNIVQVFDLRKEDGSLCIVMEYVDGITLAKLFEGARRKNVLITNDVLLLILTECLSALECAKDSEVVHRDISPDNIMVTYDGRIKLLDFGIAKSASDLSLRKTLSGNIKGKLSYLAPELIDGAQATIGSDLYSLGIVMYELATLQRLFDAKSTEELIKDIFTNKIPRLQKLAPQMPDWFAETIDQMIEAKPENRAQDPREILEKLRKRKVNHAESELADLVETISIPKLHSETVQNTKVVSKSKKRSISKLYLLMFLVSILVGSLFYGLQILKTSKSTFPVELRMREGSKIFDLNPTKPQFEGSERGNFLSFIACDQIYFEGISGLSTFWSQQKMENLLSKIAQPNKPEFLESYRNLQLSRSRRLEPLRKMCFQMATYNKAEAELTKLFDSLNKIKMSSPKEIEAEAQKLHPFKLTGIDILNLSYSSSYNDLSKLISTTNYNRLGKVTAYDLRDSTGMILVTIPIENVAENQYTCSDIVQGFWVQRLDSYSKENTNETIKVLFVPLDNRITLDSHKKNRIQFVNNLTGINDKLVFPSFCYGEVEHDIVRFSLLWTPDYSREIK